MPWFLLNWSGARGTASRGPRRSLRATLLGAALAALVAASTIGAVAARLAQDDPSPAEGSAAVIAQGVVDMPRGEVAWRVARQTARLPEDAPTGQRDPGFLLGDEGAVLVTNQPSGDQTRLAPGEATMVRPEVRQQRASLTGAPVAYTAIELVAADSVDDVGAGDLIFGGEGFAAPEGKRDLDLVRDALRSGESTDIGAAEGNAPILVMATVGVIEVRTRGDREPARLETGEAGAFAGALTIRAVEVGGVGRTATFVAAVIGPEIPREETPTATATATPRATATATPRATPAAKNGAITVSVRNCPPGQRPETVVPAECPLAEGDFDLALLTPDGATLTLADAAGSGASSATWTELPFGTYQVFQTPPIAYDVYIALDSQLTDAGGYTVTIDKENPNAQVSLYNFQPAAPGPTGGPEGDDDGDGLTNADEAVYGANPLVADTDGDGLLDGTEVATYGTSPVVYDTDGDAVGDGDEVAIGTNPLAPDAAPTPTG